MIWRQNLRHQKRKNQPPLETTEEERKGVATALLFVSLSRFVCSLLYSSLFVSPRVACFTVWHKFIDYFYYSQIALDCCTKQTIYTQIPILPHLAWKKHTVRTFFFRFQTAE